MLYTVVMSAFVPEKKHYQRCSSPFHKPPYPSCSYDMIRHHRTMRLRSSNRLASWDTGGKRLRDQQKKRSARVPRKDGETNSPGIKREIALASREEQPLSKAVTLPQAPSLLAWHVRRVQHRPSRRCPPQNLARSPSKPNKPLFMQPFASHRLFFTSTIPIQRKQTERGDGRS